VLPCGPVVQGNGGVRTLRRVPLSTKSARSRALLGILSETLTSHKFRYLITQLKSQQIAAEYLSTQLHFRVDLVGNAASTLHDGPETLTRKALVA
jgi:hypothetical protein